MPGRRDVEGLRLSERLAHCGDASPTPHLVAVLIDPGHHLGDAWFHVDADQVAHCFYLRCPEGTPRHTAWEVAHATSTDLVSWERHGTVVERSSRTRPAGRCLATGSVLELDGRYLMAFTDGWSDPQPQVRFATSDDLHTWVEDEATAIDPTDGHVVDRPWSGRPPTHWRDPFLRRRPDGAIEALVCAARADLPEDASGVVAAIARRPDGTWHAGAPPAVTAVARELECPQVHEVDGRWFLVFSTWPHLFDAITQARGGARLRPGAYAMAGPGPEGPFELVRPEPIVAEDHPVQPYAAQLVRFGGATHLLGTCWSDTSPDAISDPILVRPAGGGLTSGSSTI